MKTIVPICALALVAAAGCSAGKSETCGAGTVDQNGTCVAVDAGTTVGAQCGAGTVLVGSTCVAVDGGPGTQCGEGTVLVNGSCVAVDAGPGTQCGSGTTLTNGECVAVDAGPTARLVVEIVGPGYGGVGGEGLSCEDNTCAVVAKEGTAVTLTATPQAGYFFAGWRGVDCSASPCTVTVSGYKTIKAGFSAVTFWDGSNSLVSAARSATTAEALPFPNAPTVRGMYNFALTPDGMGFAVNARDPVTTGVWYADYWNGTTTLVTSLSSWGATFGALSPDGTKLGLVTSSSTVDVIRTDGTGLVHVTSNGGHDVYTSDYYNGAPTTRFITWSPDSAHFAWVDKAPVEGDTGSIYYNVWMADADGSNVTRLTNFSGATLSGDPSVFGADWSPDGTRIAFVSYLSPGVTRTGDGTVGPRSNLWTVNVASKALFCVTNFTGTNFNLDMASYARSGNKIVFSSTQDPSLSDNAGTRNIFSVSDDGTGLTPLTSFAVGRSYGQYWGPDGTTLLFESTVDPNDATMTSNQHIWAVRTAGADHTPVAVTTQANSWDYTPVDNND